MDDRGRQLRGMPSEALVQRESRAVLVKIAQEDPSLLLFDDREGNTPAKKAMDLAEKIAAVKGESFVRAYCIGRDWREMPMTIIRFQVFTHIPSYGGYVMQARGTDPRLLQLKREATLYYKSNGPLKEWYDEYRITPK